MSGCESSCGHCDGVIQCRGVSHLVVTVTVLYSVGCESSCGHCDGAIQCRGVSHLVVTVTVLYSVGV